MQVQRKFLYKFLYEKGEPTLADSPTFPSFLFSQLPYLLVPVRLRLVINAALVEYGIEVAMTRQL